VPAAAEIITFDDINASSGDVLLDSLNPYHGFTWTNVSVYTSTPGFPGFNNGIVSPPNAAYTAGDALGSPIVSTITAPLFDFTSAYLGSGWYDGLNVTLTGLLDGTQEFSRTVTVNTQGAQLFTFNFNDINELEVFSTASASTTDPYGCGPSGCSQITLDNVNLTLLASTVPEPRTFVFVASVLLLLVAYRHKRQAPRKS
jgi:hypothetical protein